MCILLLVGCTPVALETTHIHDIVFHPTNPEELYMASHAGLLKLKPDNKTYRVGQSLDDFMSFALNMSNPDILYRSGHPLKGGNSGVWRSDNAGEDWKKISSGHPNGNADFHALLVHPANAQHLYGWYKLRVHRSFDGGVTWTILPNQPPEIFSFAGDPQNEKRLFIATFDGIMQSTDYGETWNNVTPDLQGGLALDVVSGPNNLLYVAMRTKGFFILREHENGTWIPTFLGNLPNHAEPLLLAVHPTQESSMFAVSKAGILYRSLDHARTWTALTQGEEPSVHSHGEGEEH